MEGLRSVICLVAVLAMASGAAPLLADQSDPPNDPPNIRADFSRPNGDYAGFRGTFSRNGDRGLHRDGAGWMSGHNDSYPGNGNSDYAPESSKANGAARDNPARD